MSYNQPPPQPGYGGQPRPDPYGYGPAQPNPDPYGYGPPQPRPDPYGYGPAQPAPDPYGYGPAEPGPSASYLQQPGGYAYPPQEQQPGPYDTQPQPGYADTYGNAYGYGQQQPVAYDQPRQAYAPPDAGYGSPSRARGGRKGRTVGIVIGTIAAVAAIGGGVFALLGGGFGGSGQFTLTTPATVASVFQRQGAGKDDSALTTAQQADLKQLPSITNAHFVSANYESTAKSPLQFTGLYGQIANPAAAVAAVFVLMQKEDLDNQNIQAVGSPQQVAPASLDNGAIMQCQAFNITKAASATAAASTLTLPACAWADSSTVGFVIAADPQTALSGTTNINGAAETTAKVRLDARVEIG
jgi:hypothetical protein